MRSQVREFFSSLVLALGFAFLFQTTALATFYIPSESMVPTLEVGDRLTASKFAYGWSRFSLPFGLTLPASLGGRVLAQAPGRGEIVVFIHPKSGERMIKRLIGVPGDRVAIKRGQLWLNGEAVPREFERIYKYRDQYGSMVEVALYKELLPGGVEHEIIERTRPFHREDMAEIVIPPGRYFMMGDNRDNSADSRFREMGLVPYENLVGRAEAILYSWYSCQEEPGAVCAEGRRFATRLH
jgi:signal peptidase I